MFLVSYVALTVKARLRGFDWTLEDAAMDLGADPDRTFLRVTLPLILPGIVAAALLSFALSLDDFIITYFNSGSTVTYPLYINAAHQGRPPAADQRAGDGDPPREPRAAGRLDAVAAASAGDLTATDDHDRRLDRRTRSTST